MKISRVLTDFFIFFRGDDQGLAGTRRAVSASMQEIGDGALS